MKKTIKDMRMDACLLRGMLEGIGHLDNEGHFNAVSALVMVAEEYAGRLSDNLDRYDPEVKP